MPPKEATANAQVSGDGNGDNDNGNNDNGDSDSNARNQQATQNFNRAFINNDATDLGGFCFFNGGKEEHVEECEPTEQQQAIVENNTFTQCGLPVAENHNECVS